MGSHDLRNEESTTLNVQLLLAIITEAQTRCGRQTEHWPLWSQSV